MVLATGGAGILFGVSIAALAAFFVTRDERFDRVAEWAFVAFGVLALASVVALAGRLGDRGAASLLVSALGVIGAAGIGLGELVVALRLADFRRVSAAVTVAFVAFLGWIGGASLLIVGGTDLPANLGWLGLAAIAAGLVVVGLITRSPGVINGTREPDPRLMVAFFVPMTAIVAWMVWLGASL